MSALETCETKKVINYSKPFINYIQVPKQRPPRRACTTSTTPDTYCDFLFSDNEGSSDTSNDESDDAGEDELYDASNAERESFNKKSGEDNWVVGRPPSYQNFWRTR